VGRVGVIGASWSGCECVGGGGGWGGGGWVAAAGVVGSGLVGGGGWCDVGLVWESSARWVWGMGSYGIAGGRSGQRAQHPPAPQEGGLVWCVVMAVGLGGSGWGVGGVSGLCRGRRSVRVAGGGGGGGVPPHPHHHPTLCLSPTPVRRQWEHSRVLGANRGIRLRGHGGGRGLVRWQTPLLPTVRWTAWGRTRPSLARRQCRPLYSTQAQGEPARERTRRPAGRTGRRFGAGWAGGGWGVGVRVGDGRRRPGIVPGTGVVGGWVGVGGVGFVGVRGGGGGARRPPPHPPLRPQPPHPPPLPPSAGGGPRCA